MWIAHISEQNESYNKKIFGIDGFIGLPYAEGCFRIGDFKTTREQCLTNINFNANSYKNNHKNIFIKEALFSKKALIAQYLQANQSGKFCFIHIDCDVSQSALEIFDLLQKYDLIADESFIVFDDFYCTSSLKYTVDDLFQNLSAAWNIESYGRTNLTQTFKFIRNNN